MNKLLALLIAMDLATMLSANNISISNVSLTGKNTTDHYTMVQFDISWENSWRTSIAPNNWDAAWVFVKYRIKVANYISDAGATSSEPDAVYNSSEGAINWGVAYNCEVISSSGKNIQVFTTQGLSIGMPLTAMNFEQFPPTNAFVEGTVVSQIFDGQSFEVSQDPICPPNIINGYGYSNKIIVNSTAGLFVGMPVVVTAGNGTFAPGTIVSTITGPTSFIVSTLPITPLSDGAVVTGFAPTIITVGSTAGLTVGMPVNVTAGTGEFAEGTTITECMDATHFKISTLPVIPLSDGAVVTAYPFPGNWEHAKLNTIGFAAPPGSTIAPASDNTGAFIYRNADGTGTFIKTGIQLRWNYGDNGVTDDAVIDIQVYAIEMVYVPQGSFFVGSGETDGGAFFKFPTTTNPYEITSEEEIIIGSTANNLNYATSYSYGDGLGPIPASFPKGYAAFYCMKYEISQQQYVDFLNSLSYSQQILCSHQPPNSASGTYLNDAYRNKLKIITSGTNNSIPAIYATDYPYVACNYLSWTDLSAYLDWSGLRPMTELEFEKACRGTIAPVVNEFAWGTTDVVASDYTLSNSGANNETIATNYSTTAGNAAFYITCPSEGSIYGPVRVGIFAGTNGNTGRITAGASYYGIMEMSGNIWERAITVGHPLGRTFSGAHGNGAILTTGYADVTNWPDSDAYGVGLRGGDVFLSTISNLHISNRNQAAFRISFASEGSGGRGVRSVP